MRSESEKDMEQLEEEFLLKSAGIAYRDYLLDEFEKAENDPDIPDLSPELVRQIDQNVAAGLRTIRRKERKKKGRKRTLKLAACFALLLVLLPAAALSVRATRSDIANYLIQNFSQFGEVKYDSDDHAAPPFGWDCEYYPRWLPEGYSFRRISLETHGDFIWYSNAEKQQIEFSVLKDVERSPHFDQEDMSMKPITVKGQEAQLYFSADKRKHALVLPVEGHVLAILAEISESDLIKIAESIKFK